ncbi:apyrase-like [Melitaea cinxia]|uniref:apyrase-like n=1 Tax=Melitaea cinxia TaxID=113334 RepID=UPI001E270DF9|nr:apyrase-like [Melitaea cinxia]
MSVVLVILLTISVVKTQNSDGLFELNIVHYNDFHAHFDEILPTGSPCNPTVGDCIGGFSRLYTAIRQAMEDEPDSLLLNAGDTFQGTIWYNFLRWNVSQHFMNMLPHDAHVLGNHEFDHGIEGLLPYLEKLESPMLGANVNTTFEPEMAPYVKNHIVVQRNGRDIGIIGVLLRTFSAPIGRIIMEDELEAINREADLLTAQGVDIIIVLSHVGYNSDISLAERVSSNVDIIVGGHSHTLLYTGEAPDGSQPIGNYPTVVTQANGHRIPIVQAAAYTRYLGDIKLFIDEAGNVISWQGQPIYLGTSIVKDPHMEALLEPWRQEVDAVGKEVLGRAIVPLRRGCYRGECNVVSWACDGLIDEMVQYANADAWGGVDVCLMNAGGVRAHLGFGEITTEALLMVFPFENNIQMYDLEGKYILEALEFSVGVSQNDPTNFYSSRLLQLGGLRMVVNATAPAGSRVSAAVRCVRCAVPRYEPLRPDAVYRVLSQSYIGDGGGGYTMLSQNRKNLVTLDLDYVMLQRYMHRQRTFFKDLDGRIQIVY